MSILLVCYLCCWSLVSFLGIWFVLGLEVCDLLCCLLCLTVVVALLSARRFFDLIVLLI